MMQDKCDVSDALTAIRTPVAVVPSPRGPYAVCYDRARATTLSSDPNGVVALLPAIYPSMSLSLAAKALLADQAPLWQTP